MSQEHWCPWAALQGASGNASLQLLSGCGTRGHISIPTSLLLDFQGSTSIQKWDPAEGCVPQVPHHQQAGVLEPDCPTMECRNVVCNKSSELAASRTNASIGKQLLCSWCSLKDKQQSDSEPEEPWCRDCGNQLRSSSTQLGNALSFLESLERDPHPPSK